MRGPRFVPWRPARARLLVAGLLLTLLAAGCASQPAATRGSVAGCTRAGVTAVKDHVTLTTLPAACQGLSQSQVSLAVGSALHSAAIGADGKAAQRARIGAASHYLANLASLAAAAPAAKPAKVAIASAGPQLGHTALAVAALIGWLITIGFGMVMMVRWIFKVRWRRRRAWGALGANLGHFALSVVGLVLWIVYLATSSRGLGVASAIILAVVTALGMAVLALPVAEGGSPVRLGGLRAARGSQRRRNYLTVASLGAHIIFAVVTVLLAVLAALGTG